jgi:hypothetical protein
MMKPTETDSQDVFTTEPPDSPMRRGPDPVRFPAAAEAPPTEPVLQVIERIGAAP